ncbi:MAG: RHS repeat-associated core domain-containing protein [Planctomycetes bacterium]|nr:RHS repeat-associated core domain-containing protein [Planctomycetota bacterium]
MVWNGENRLISATVAGTTSTYSYDYRGRRISKQVGADPATRFIYEGWNVIAEYVSGTLDRSYTWGMDLSGSMQGAGGVGGLLAVHIGTENYFPTYDGNGNVGEYLDASGAVAAHFEYDAFGNETVSTSSAGAPTFAHRFSTKPLDGETGLYYYGYRYFESMAGRWLSRDPIEEKGGVALFVFVANNGLGKVDRLGLEEISKFEIAHHIWSIGLVNAIHIGPAADKGKAAGRHVTPASPVGSGSGGEQDAVRHCVWMCSLAKSIGGERAKKVGDIHEAHATSAKEGKQPAQYSSAKAFDKADTEMDLFNNSAGIAVASAGDSCEAGCRDRLRKGCLRVNAPGGYGPPKPPKKGKK